MAMVRTPVIEGPVALRHGPAWRVRASRRTSRTITNRERSLPRGAGTGSAGAEFGDALIDHRRLDHETDDPHRAVARRAHKWFDLEVPLR